MNWIKISKNYILFIFIFTFFLPVFTTIYSEDTINPLLSWAIVIKDKEQKSLISTCKSKIVIKAHQKFKFLLQPGRNSFIYLFYLSDKGEFIVCFRYDSNDSGTGERRACYTVPEKLSEWFRMEETSSSEFPDKYYLVASAEPLHDLDSKIKKFLKASKNKAGLQKEILEEISVLIKKTCIPENDYEIPVPFGGSIKTDIIDNLDIFKIINLSLYTKVITICLGNLEK